MTYNRSRNLRVLAAIVIASFLVQQTDASLGDHLPEFRACVADCVSANCGKDGSLYIPLQRRLLFWTCPAECDYACQHITTQQRLSRDPPYLAPIVQYHGKWPFYRFMGMQEPASVLFSLLNYLAHDYGMSKLRQEIPASYPLRKYYLGYGYVGLAAWIFSMIFHTRDFNLTEKLDYFGAGAFVMYGLYYTPIRIFRLDQASSLGGHARQIVRYWGMLCLGLYLMHVGFLTFVRFDYTYNMAANVVIGIISNILWTYFSITRYIKIGRLWAAWPGLIVAWIILAMSFELFDFPPWKGMVDAHALWHLGTVLPTLWWYKFLLKDAKEDMQKERLKV
ncbi:Mn2+ homeostasis protein-like protein Per1 [Polychaeton citri CBS 116435]|uniref:Post-GPI attachment to proteins factor 3 n=1 Tax=Polychaeton citri CBS 116435 TaxID=1314669 RepID=A0A9P4PY09_9PEZI|nr:Mn2+ homeostasis protein-like protein Per1 [Polychaeton citri CBS 116435]